MAFGCEVNITERCLLKATLAISASTQKNPMNTLYAPPTSAPQFIQTKLAIGSVHDPAESEADAVADHVMQHPMSESAFEGVSSKGESKVQRKCATCEQEEKVQKKENSSAQQSQNAGFASPQLMHQLKSAGGQGQPLDGGTRNFMEARLGANLSSINIHTGTAAAEMNRELNAKAFTVGAHIYFNEGQYQPETAQGKHLLAHELAHTMQQGAVSSEAQGGARGPSIQKRGPMISRKLQVLNADKEIFRTNTGKSTQTMGQVGENYLQSLCPEGSPKVAAKTGEVSSGLGNCAPIKDGKFPKTCDRLCKIIHSDHAWRISINDFEFPNTVFDNPSFAMQPGVGTGGTVHVPSPNNTKEFGSVAAGGTFFKYPEFMVLSHELLGHGFMGDQGTHTEDQELLRGRGGHNAVIVLENELNTEHGRSLRGNHRDPYCGESYSVERGQTPDAKNAKFGDSLAVCKQWRKEYNALNNTDFSISDTVPPKPDEKLPHHTVVNGKVIL
jgi:hypothetical protein